MRLAFISPPFYSHFQPMLALAKGFRLAGAQVIVACTPPFQAQVEAAGLAFFELAITNNSNTGIALKSQQAEGERLRMQAFIDATRQGPFVTLRYQALNRKADMLVNPERLVSEITRLQEQHAPDWYVVDQLSYGVTLALHALELPYLTFCPGHPTYIPIEGQRFGVPYAWPAGMQPPESELNELQHLADEVDRHFTSVFNDLLAQLNPRLPAVRSAFRLASPHALLFNYPDFGHLPCPADGPRCWFAGASFEPGGWDATWQARVSLQKGEPKIMISLGTFLSARDDVIARLVTSIRAYLPDAILYVAAGSSLDRLAPLAAENVHIAEFLPQTGLLPHMDLVIHHAGNNSFTETLFYGKPAIAMPFSSDQFAIAHDLQRFSLGRVLDPNGFTEAELQEALDWALGPGTDIVSNWRADNPPLGIAAVATEVLSELKHIDELHPHR